MHSRETRRIAWIVAAAGIAAIALIGFGAVRAAVLTSLALTVPGLAITFALFPRGRLRLSERLLLTIGLSLGVVVVVTAALGESSVFLDRTTVLFGLAEVAAVAALVAIGRALARPATPAAAVEPDRAVRPRWFRIGLVDASFFSARWRWSRSPSCQRVCRSAPRE